MDYLPSLITRIIARAIDTLIIFATVIILVQMFNIDTQSLLVQISEGVFWLWYFIFIPFIWAGLTIGKKVTQTKLRMNDGSDVTLQALFIREFFIALVYTLTLGILLIVSFVVMYKRNDKRMIHDIIAKTQVIKTDYLM